MRSKVQKAGLFLALAVVVSFGWALFSSEAAAAGKPSEINVVIIGDFSGPYAPLAGGLRPGIVDAWEYINTKLGGVHGVKVTPIFKDMNGKMDIGMAKYNEAINMKPKPAFVDIYMTPLSAALRQRYVEDGVVGFHSGSTDSLYPIGNSYGYFALFPEQTAVALKWIKDNWKEKRNPRIGIITWDSGFGRSILKKEFFEYLKKIGVDLVGTEVFGVKEVDLTVQLLKLKQANPDYLVTSSIGAGPLAIKKGCKEMGWKVPLVNNTAGDWGTIRLAPDLFEGDIVTMPTKSFDETEDPSIKNILGVFNANKRTINEKTHLYFIGWQNAIIKHKVMTSVVDKYGWDGLTTENIKNALENIRDFQVLGGITIVSFTHERRSPTKARVYKVTKGKFLPVTPFMEVPDLKPRD